MPIVPSREQMLLDAQLHRLKHRWDSTGVEPSFDFMTIRANGRPYYVIDPKTEDRIEFDVVEFLKGIDRIAAEVKASGKPQVMFYLDSLGALGQEE